jgi:hypothetical protein
MSLFKKELNIVEKVEKVEKVSDPLPQHPMLQWSGPSSESKRDHLEDYEEVQPFEESEGFMDRFRSADTMRKRFQKLCEKLKEPVPTNIDKMTKKEIIAAIKVLKGKHPKSSRFPNIWKNFDTLARLIK